MRQSVTKIIASILIAVFVNFMFSNTVFIHSHKFDDGRTITHSHPYSPCASHSHSAEALSQIAQFNLASSTVQPTQAATLTAPSATIDTIFLPCLTATVDVCLKSYPLRAPPAC